MTTGTPYAMTWGEPGATRLDDFAGWVRERGGPELRDYETLHTWSTEHPDEFWGAVWDFFDVVTSQPYAQVVSGGPMPHHRWFEGARLNFVDQIFRHRDLDGAAVVSIDEAGARSELSWTELEQQSLAFAATLRDHGVEQGDRVVGYLTNGPEAIVAFLGTAAIGAIWAGCAPDYGAATAATRMGQLTPKVLVAATAYEWAGATYDRRAEVADLTSSLDVTTVIEVPRADLRLDPTTIEADVLPWSTALSRKPIEQTEQVDASHPLWVLFSSGTTGVPKGIVHSHGGVIAVQLAMLGLAHDLGPGDTMFWYTTPNWMMWNIVVAVLLAGVRTVTYEGNPAHPDPTRLWQIVADEQVTLFGTSPGHLQGSQNAGLVPKESPGADPLRVIAATGAPVPAVINQWVRDAVGTDIPVLSVCGGTDVVSAFLGCSPWLPVYDGELSGPSLGVAAHAYSVSGEPVRDEVGELVITSPGPSMPLYFWNDPDKERYVDTYFSAFPGAWRQGDWVTQTSRGSFVVHGRSDSTLNRKGVRFGSSELYAIVESDPAVAEALVLGVEQPDGGYRMPMFVVPAPGHELGEADLDRLRHRLRTEASPRHVPDEIHVVPAIPHTRTGKKIEVPLKRILQGADPAAVLDPGAVDDPSLVQEYADLARSWNAD